VSTRPQALVLRALGVGDLLTAVPALRGLRHALPGHEIVLAAPEALRPLVVLIGSVDRLLPTPELGPVPWKGRPPDVAVNLHGRGPQSHQALSSLSPGRLVAFANREAGVEGPEHRDDEHEVHRWAGLVSESFGVDVDPADLRIDRPTVEPPVRDAVVVHPGAKAGARRWPADRFAEVVRHCLNAGSPVVITGSREEIPLARRLQRRAGIPVDTVLAGRTTLDELGALVAAARLVVSGDTGVAHLATAYGTPSVVLFGPTPPSQWGPPPCEQHAVLWRPTATANGHPLADELDPSLDRISVEDVVAAVAQRLGPQAPLSGQSGRGAGAGARLRGDVVTEPGEGGRQPVLEGDLGLPAKGGAGERDVRAAHLGVVLGKVEEDHR
jgi:ADP-heptose:LPS heptosyltransferase